MNPDTAQPEEQLHRDCAYQPNPGYYDETVAPEGTMRTHWQPLMEPLEQMGHAGFARRWQEGRRVIHEHVPTLWPPPAARLRECAAWRSVRLLARRSAR